MADGLPPIRVEGAWPALVDREVFEQVQGALRSRALAALAGRPGSIDWPSGHFPVKSIMELLRACPSYELPFDDPNEMVELSTLLNRGFEEVVSHHRKVMAIANPEGGRESQFGDPGRASSDR